MKNFLNRSAIATLLFFAVAIATYAQNTTAVSELENASNLYDQNGWQQGSSMQTDGRLGISASSGSVSYSYPISQQSLDGHPINVALNYASSVEHTAFFRYLEPPLGDTSAPRWSRFTQNRPLWIVAVNEFAVQTLSMAGNYHQDPQWNLGTGRTTSLNDRDLVWCVDGYDFGNRMLNFNSRNAAQSMGNKFIDVIRLLRADGSVMELRNAQPTSATPPSERPELYTGYYFVNEVNGRGFAYVEFDSLNWPEHLYNYVSGMGYQYVPRRVHYYPGNGLEYVFKERLAPYGTLAYSGYNGNSYEGWDTLYGGAKSGPSIFYLETITTGSGASIDVSRIRHYASYVNSDLKDSTKGLSFISGMTGHRFAFPVTFSQNYQEGRNNSMVIEALGRTITVWFDSVSTSGNGADKFSLAGASAWTTSENSSFSWIREQYKSAAGYVTAIADAENRVTNFTYERVPRSYIGYGFAPGHDTVLLKNFRLTEVREPTRTFKIAYQPINATIQAGASYVPSLVNDVVDSVARYDRDNLLLSTDHYAFTYKPIGGGDLGYLIDSSVFRSTDHITGQSASTVRSYYTYTLPSLPAATTIPKARFTSLYKTVRMSGRDTVTSFICYGDSLRDPNAASWGTPYLILPTAAWTTVNGLTKSHVSYDYEVDIVREFGGNGALADNFGWDVLTGVTRVHRPDDTSRILLVDTVRYLHLPLVDTSFTRYDTLWNEKQSFANYHESFWRTTTNLDHAIRDYWEEVAFDPQVFVARIDTLQGSRKIPPLFGLPQRRTLHDTTGTILTGRIFTYATDAAQETASRGSLLVDSIIGEAGAQIILGNQIDYGRWLGKNLPTRFTNANGATLGSLYDYSSIDPVGRIVRNNNEATDLTTLTGVYFAHRFELPLGRQRHIRRYHDSSTLLTDTLTTLLKRTFFGLVSGTIDANGWYSRAEYDRAARLKKSWRPFDFPQDSAGAQYDGTENVALYGGTWRVRQIDSVECFDGTKFIYPRLPDTTLYNDSLFAAKRSVTVDPACPPCHSAMEGDKGSSRSLLTTCNFGRLHTSKDQYIGVIDYLADSSSALVNAVSLDSAWLQLYAISMAGSCVTLNVSIPQFEFSRSYNFNCETGSFVDDDDEEHGHGKAKGPGRELTSSSSPSHTMSYLKVNLAEILDDLLSLDYNNRLVIYLKVNTPDARIDFVNGGNSADTRPSIVLKGRFGRTRFQPGFEEDYTLSYNYRDDSLITTVSSKVDDIHHTNNDLSGLPGSSRYTEARRFHGPENILRRLETTIGSPHAPLRIDSTLISHTGWNRTVAAFDPEGDSIAVHYDPTGRPVSFVHGDGVFANTVYRSGTPADCGITDTTQDFYSFCSASIHNDENGVPHIRYYDAFNRLRRHIDDPGGLRTTTLFDYDILGRLTRVVTPAEGIIEYSYDSFGRLRAATHPDMGTTSYAYDRVGNIRFAQDEQQAAQGLLTYFQYDDLNRPTLVGEAAIDETDICDPYNEDDLFASNSCPSGGSRLTDQIDGSHLQIDPEEGILTANPTLWMSAPPPPLFPSSDTYALRTCTLQPEIRLHESATPETPLIHHLAPIYLSNGVERAKLKDFEDLRVYPSFARMAAQYDTLPATTGPIWSAFPDSSRWNRIAPAGRLRNQRGRQAAMAYRERGSEPYYFATFSYDERGRLEAILRYTENIGFDAVYYRYTSANSVASVTVVDPLYQHTTWYGYDANGRLDTVWTKLQGPGDGLMQDNDFTKLEAPVIATRPSSPDIVYSYTRGNQVEQMAYPAIGLSVDYAYNQRSMLDSIIATLNQAPLPPLLVFRERLQYAPGGEVLQQSYGRYGANTEQDYTYDNLSRLTGWTNGMQATSYLYDALGNRTLRTESGEWAETYEYDPGTSRLDYRLQHDDFGNDTIHGYSFNADGAQTVHLLTYNTSIESRILRSEDLAYSFRNLMNRGQVRHLRNGDTRRYDWRYRYGPSGEREQKRLYKVTSGVVPAPDSVSYPWAYYLQGAGGSQLAVYHGQQFDSLSLKCGDNGRRVYMYPYEYRTFGLGPAANIISRPDGTKEYQVPDHLGSPRMTFDGMASNIASADYGPFGEQIAVPGVPRRESFIDRECDPETSLDNFGLRAYDPDRGAFASPEPLWPLMPNTSPYAYVHNNPLSWSDPSGLAAEDPGGSTPLEPAAPQQDPQQRWWEIEQLLGPRDPERRKSGSPEPRRDRAEKMGPPLAPTGNRGEKIIPPPIIIEPSQVADAGTDMEVPAAILATTFAIDATLLADDVTIVGVVDDVAIPFVTVIGLLAAAAVAIWILANQDSGAEGLEFDDPTRNPAQDNPLSKGDIKKLEDAGFNIHGLKGGKNTGPIDLYKDAKGNIYIKPKGGKGPGEPLNINLNHL